MKIIITIFMEICTSLVQLILNKKSIIFIYFLHSNLKIYRKENISFLNYGIQNMYYPDKSPTWAVH